MHSINARPISVPGCPSRFSTQDDPSASPADLPILHESHFVRVSGLLETLSPLERAVFVLRQVFDYEYSEIAEIVGKEEDACRQLFSRAKKHVAAHRPRFHPDPEQHQRLLNEFLRAVEVGSSMGWCGC